MNTPPGCARRRADLETSPRLVDEVLFGVDIAGRCTLSVPDALYAGFAGLSTTINTPATDRAYRGLMGAGVPA